MMSADMSSTLSPSMPVLKRISPEVPRIYARSKLYARPMPTLQMTAPENKPATVTSLPGARDERAQSVIKVAVTVKSEVKTKVIAPEPKVMVVRVEDAVRLGRLESRSNGRYRVRQEPTELQAPAMHKHAHQHIEGAKIPGLADKLAPACASAEPEVMSAQPEVASPVCLPIRVTGFNDVIEEADQGPPTLTMDDYFAKLSEEKGRMINKVFARIASVSSSHEDQQKNAANTAGVIRRPEYEDISDEEDLARETYDSETQHVLHNSPLMSSDYCTETDAVSHRESGAKDTLELLSVLEGTDYLMGGTERNSRRQVCARRTSAPELVETAPSPVRVGIQRITRSASLPCDDGGMDQPTSYPKLRISRCSEKSWKVIDKSPPLKGTDVASLDSAATDSPPPVSAGEGGESVVNNDWGEKSGETCVITSTDKSAAVKVQASAVSDVNLTPTGASSGDRTSLPQNLASSVVVGAEGSTDADPVLKVEDMPASGAAEKEIPQIDGVHPTATATGDSDEHRASSDAVRRLSEEKSNARPEVIAAFNGVGVVKLAPEDMTATVTDQIDISQVEVETITGTEIPVLNDLGLGATKEMARKRGRPPLQSLKKDLKARSLTPPLATSKKTIARKKSTSRRNFRHESIQTFKPTTAPPPWRYKGRAHVRSPDITLAPQRKLSVDLKASETEIGPVSSPSPNELVIDLNPDMAEAEVAGDCPEVVNVAGDRGCSSTESCLRRALSDPGYCVAVNVPPKGPPKEAAVEIPEKRDFSPSAQDDDGSDGRKKMRKKEEGGDIVQAVQARLATKQHHEKGRRLAQELPGYNWLEEKILNGGVTQVLPPKIGPLAATCVGDIPEVAMRLASVTENLVITKVQNTQQPSIITGVSASVDVQKPAVTVQGKPVEQVQSVERDSIARRTLIQLANGGDMEVTMARIPPQNNGAVSCDRNDKRRREETFVAKQMLHDFNAKNQMNQENLKRIENLAAQQRNCAGKLPASKAPPASWGFAENVATMARHTATSFDTGVGLTRGYPGPLPQEIIPLGNPRIANGMAQGEPRMAPHRVAAIPTSSAHCAISALPAAMPPSAAERVAARRASGGQSRSPQFPADIYRIPQIVDAPQNASREQNQKQSAETAEVHRLLYHEQQKLRGIHPRPAVPTATAAATARSSFPSLPEPAQTQPMPPIRLQQPPPTHQFPDHVVNPLLAQNHSNAKERNPQISLAPQAIHSFKERRFMTQNVGQLPPQFLPGNQFAQHQNSMLVAQSAEYRDPRNGSGNAADLRNVPVNYAPTRLLQQTLMQSDGRSRAAQETFQRKSQGGQAPNHRSPTEQAAVPSSVKEHLNSQMFMANSQFAPMPQMHPNLPPQSLLQLRQREAQKMAEQWRNEMERGRFAQTARVEATPVNRISPNAPTQRFVSPQQRATNQHSHASIHDGPLNHPFQLPPFSPPFTSVPGQTGYRPPGPPPQQSFKAPQQARIDLVRPANPQNAVPNYQQQMPYNFQPVGNMPPQFSRNLPNEYLELLHKRALRLEYEQQEVKRRHLAQRSAMQKEEQLHKATQREIARLEAEKEKTLQEAIQEEGRLRLELQQADLAARHEPPAIHAQGPWNNVIHHQMLQHQSRDQQTVSPRSEQQHQSGPQQRVHMSGGHVSPRFLQQQLSPKVAGAEQVHHRKYCSQDPKEIQHMKMQQQMNNQVAQVLQYQQMSPQSMLRIQQQKQNTQSSQQVQPQTNALSVQESQRPIREHEHRILQQQQNQRIMNNPQSQALSPNQPMNSEFAIGSHRGTILRDNGSNKKQHNAPTSLDKTQKSIENGKEFSVDNLRFARSRKMLQGLLTEETIEVASLARHKVSDPTTPLQLPTNNRIMENDEYQSGSQRLPLREGVETLHHRRNSLENERDTAVLKNNPLITETCNKVHVEDIQCPLPQSALGDHSSNIKPLPPLQPLPIPVRKMPELEKLLVHRGDLQSTVPGNSDLQPISFASGEKDAPIGIVDLDTSGEDASEEVKFLPRAHQASFFSTATIKSGKERFIHRSNAASKYAVDNEPIDLSSSKRKAADTEITKPTKKFASSIVEASLLSPINTGKTTALRAESAPLQNFSELQSEIANEEIEEKQYNIQQKIPLQPKTAEEPDTKNGNQLNTRCSPDFKSQKIVQASPKFEVNKEKIEDVLPTNQPNVGKDRFLMKKYDSKCVSDVSEKGYHICDNGEDGDVQFLQSVSYEKGDTERFQVAVVLPVAHEQRFRSYSDTDGDEKMKARFRTVKPINSQDDEINSILEAKRSLERESIPKNCCELKAPAAISRTNFNKLPYKQIRRTILHFKGLINESRNSTLVDDSTMPSQSNLVRNDGKKNLLTTITTKVNQTRQADKTVLHLTKQTSAQQALILNNEPSAQNVTKSGSNSGESECSIQIANIFTVKDVNPDGTYNERGGHCNENEAKQPMPDDDNLLVNKTAVKSLPNPSTPPYIINNKDRSGSMEMKKDVNDNEGLASIRGTLKVDRTNVCQKRKSSENSEDACLREEPTASKLHKQVSVIHEPVAQDTAKTYQTLTSADNANQFQSDNCILVDEDPIDVLPPSRNDPKNSRTHPTPVVSGNSGSGNIVEGLPICDVCGTLATCSCSLCQNVFYCSRQCQRSHWNIHSPQCKKWAAERKP